MFLHLSVILFTAGESAWGFSVQGISVQGVSVQGGSLSGNPPATVWLRAGGTHLTGMHSCYISHNDYCQRNCNIVFVKTKLWQGDVFTPVCDSVHCGGICLGVLCPGDLSPGGLCPGRVSVR